MDRPHAVAGSSLPDWLATGARRSRIDLAALRETELPPGSPEADLAEGVLRHHADDAWFHRGEAFRALNTRIGAHLRQRLAEAGTPVRMDKGPRVRTQFVAHVLIEMLLDAELLREDDTLLDRYYGALDGIDAEEIEAFVGRHGRRPAPGFAAFLDRFREQPFLRLYVTAEGIADLLGRVHRRVGRIGLPEGMATFVEEVRPWVHAERDALWTAPEAGPSD